MRISDWSSDVCSSDLRDFAIAGQAFPETPEEMARLFLIVRRADRPHLEKARVERRGQAPDDPALPRRVPAFEHDDAALAVDDVRGLEPFEPILERREIVGIVAVIFGAGFIIGKRSEEHTSELQSL